MYHQIVAGIVRQGFLDISAGEFEKVLAQFSPKIVFSFLRITPEKKLLGSRLNSDEVAEFAQAEQYPHCVHAQPKLE